jgi:hypothetical protein
MVVLRGSFSPGAIRNDSRSPGGNAPRNPLERLGRAFEATSNGLVNPPPNAAGGAAGPVAAPNPLPAGTDSYGQAEGFWLMRISGRLDTIITLLTFIMLATLGTAFLILTRL